MNPLPMINPISTARQTGQPPAPVARQCAVSLRKAVRRTSLFETTMMSFHSSIRWTRRAEHIAIAVLLFAALADRASAQDSTAAITEISIAATMPAAISQTNSPVPVKTVESSPAVKDEAASETTAKETSTSVPEPARSPGVIAAVRTNSAPPPLSLDSFKLIADRNIFNQSRVPGSRGTQSGGAEPGAGQTRIEAIALVGTMIYEKGNFAFFDGSTSQYRKTIKPGDSIGAYKLTEVGPNQIRLVGENQEWTLKVGQELRRENEGEWKVAAHSTLMASAEPVSSTNSSTESSTAADAESDGSEPAPAPDAGPISDVLRRLMEAREKEVGR